MRENTNTVKLVFRHKPLSPLLVFFLVFFFRVYDDVIFRRSSFLSFFVCNIYELVVNF